jgi:hypothetical protein
MANTNHKHKPLIQDPLERSKPYIWGRVGMRWLAWIMSLLICYIAADFVYALGFNFFFASLIGISLFFFTPAFATIPLNLGSVIKYPVKILDIWEDFDDLHQNVLRFEIETFDGARLETYEDINYSKTHNISPDKQKYAVIFNGTGAHSRFYYDGIQIGALKKFNNAQYQNLYRNHGYNILGFNYRGCYASTGRKYSLDDLVVDGITQVQYLLDKGIIPCNIVLHGHSMGGHISLRVYNYFLSKNITLGLNIVDNSFGRLEEVVSRWSIIKAFVKVMTKLVGSYADSVKEIEKIQTKLSENKDSMQRILVLNVSNKDGIINGEGQLADALKKRQYNIHNNNQTVISWEHRENGYMNHCRSLYNCTNDVKNKVVLPSTNTNYPKEHLALFKACGIS